MALNSAQITTLANYVNTQPALKQFLIDGSDNQLTAALNAPTNPAFYVFKKYVQMGEIGAAVNYIAVEAMTDANRGRITTFYTMNPEGCNPERADVRSYWANTFSGALGGEGANTRAALESLWRRVVSVAERQFATGTGTDVAPGSATWEGTVDDVDSSKIAVALGLR